VRRECGGAFSLKRLRQQRLALAELLLNKLAACRERIQKLRSKLPRDAATIRSNELLEAFLSFQLFLLIQDASDIANHLVAAMGLGVPASQREAFELLARAGILTSEVALEMAAAAGLRNRIAHAYGDVYPVRLVQEAPAGLAVIERYLDLVGPVVATLKSPQP
jgi:uncharacterized protein YutE (UPF0331/DUF86 family)